MKLIDRYCEYAYRKGCRDESIKTIHYELTGYESYMWEKNVKKILEVTESELEEYLAYLYLKLNIRTISKRFGFIKNLYRYCVKQGMILRSPAEWIELDAKIDHMPKDVPDEKQMECLLAQPNGYTYDGIRDKALLEFMYSTGVRRREVLGLKVADIDLKEGIAYIREAKGGNRRKVPVGRQAIACIKKYLKVTRPVYLKKTYEDHMFLSRRGIKLKGYVLTGIIYKYRNRSKLTKNICPHKIRHACAVHMLRGGADILTIQKMLGHTRLSTTQLYTKLDPKDIKEMHKKCHPRAEK